MYSINHEPAAAGTLRRRWTDALLLWQAMERDGVLVTFDSGVKELAAGELRDHLLLLESR